MGSILQIAGENLIEIKASKCSCIQNIKSNKSKSHDIVKLVKLKHECANDVQEKTKDSLWVYFTKALQTDRRPNDQWTNQWTDTP